MIPFFMFLTYLQPGILFPWLAPYKINFIAGIFIVILGLLFGKFHFEKKRIHFCVLLFYFAQIISVYYSGFLGMAEQALLWFPLISVYFLIALTVEDEKKLKNCIWGFLVGAAVVIYYGISRLWWDPIANIKWIIGAYGMYENQNDYSYMIIFSFPFWVWFMFHYNNYIIKLICLTMIIACITGIILSLSRGGILAFILENILFFWLYIKRKSIRYLIIQVMIILSIFLALFVWEKRELAQLGRYSYEDSKDSRSDLWITGRNMFLSNPITGVGSLRFSEYTKQYLPPWASYADIKGKNAHNTYIEVLATSGLVGFIPFMYSIYLSIKFVYKNIKTKVLLPKDNLAIPVFVASSCYFFRSIFNSKVATPEFFMVLAICSINYQYIYINMNHRIPVKTRINSGEN